MIDYIEDLELKALRRRVRNIHERPIPAPLDTNKTIFLSTLSEIHALDRLSTYIEGEHERGIATSKE